MEKLLWTIGETAALLDENVSAIRFWTNSFPDFIKPSRTQKGDRRYTADDIQTLKELRFLLKDKGLSLEGARQRLQADRAKVSGRVKAIGILEGIRDRLSEIKKGL
ncbi:MAG: MerR family transcriptional regulator [Bacteroidales bacterium]|nr:MerR family transcriptional regulator [Bacteroidales bacterium]